MILLKVFTLLFRNSSEPPNSNLTLRTIPRVPMEPTPRPYHKARQIGGKAAAPWPSNWAPSTATARAGRKRDIAVKWFREHTASNLSRLFCWLIFCHYCFLPRKDTWNLSYRSMDRFSYVEAWEFAHKTLAAQYYCMCLSSRFLLSLICSFFSTFSPLFFVASNIGSVFRFTVIFICTLLCTVSLVDQKMIMLKKCCPWLTNQSIDRRRMKINRGIFQGIVVFVPWFVFSPQYRKYPEMCFPVFIYIFYLHHVGQAWSNLIGKLTGITIASFNPSINQSIDRTRIFQKRLPVFSFKKANFFAHSKRHCSSVEIGCSPASSPHAASTSPRNGPCRGAFGSARRCRPRRTSPAGSHVSPSRQTSRSSADWQRCDFHGVSERAAASSIRVCSSRRPVWSNRPSWVGRNAGGRMGRRLSCRGECPAW